MGKDRRIRKTRTSLIEALKYLMKHKMFSSITVSELCEQADVNRSTFYYHYNSTVDVLYELHESFFEKMARKLELFNKSQESFDNLSEVTALLNTAADENTDLYFMLIHDDVKLLQKHICQYFSTILTAEKATPLERYSIIYHLLASITVVQLWLSDHCPCSEEEMANLVCKMPYHGIYF